MDRARFATLMKALCAAKRIEATEALLMGYWIGCQGLTDEAFAQAIGRSLRETDKMPSPHELRRLGGEEQAETRAIHAWATVLRSISTVGAYQSVDFGPLVNAVVRAMGGWVELCGRNGENLREWGRKDFEATYRRLAGSALIGEMGAHLGGICERTNKALGQAPEIIRLLDAESPGKLLTATRTEEDRDA
jgi:hypothetical protein